MPNTFNEWPIRTEVTPDGLEAVVRPIVATLLAKNADYGNAFDQDGVVGITVRLKDKLNRLHTLSDGRKALVADERIEDTVRDMIGYGLLMLLRLESEKVAARQFAEWRWKRRRRWIPRWLRWSRPPSRASS